MASRDSISYSALLGRIQEAAVNQRTLIEGYDVHFGKEDSILLDEKWRVSYLLLEVDSSSYALTFSDVHFHDIEGTAGIMFMNIGPSVLSFENCQFDGPLQVECKKELGAWFNMSDSKTKSISLAEFINYNFVKNDHNGSLNIYKHMGFDMYNIVLQDCKVHVDNQFEIKTHVIGRNRNLVSISLGIGVNVEGIRIANCEFQHNTETDINSIWIDGVVDDLDIVDCPIPTLDLSSVLVNKSFVMINSPIENHISIENAIFQRTGTLLPWENIQGFKLKLLPDYRHFVSTCYNGKTDEELQKSDVFRQLLSSYSKLFQIYKNRSDLESANACYVEMKDMETRRLKYKWKTEGGMNNYLNYQLNVFLKFFAIYGTSPIQCLKISFWVALWFAVLYFFTYSNWDKINRTFLIKQHRKLLKYFRSEYKLGDFYTDRYRRDFKTYTDYKKELEESILDVPFFITVLGKPLYHLSIFRHKTMLGLYGKTEMLQGRWADLKPGRKAFVGSIIGLTIFFYLIYLGLVRALNSLMLSVNTFSTLGFGDIPVKGLSRYMAIIEGFIGWFLLSIFSVSLISQILQN